MEAALKNNNNTKDTEGSDVQAMNYVSIKCTSQNKRQNIDK